MPPQIPTLIAFGNSQDGMREEVAKIKEITVLGPIMDGALFFFKTLVILSLKLLATLLIITIS